MLSPLDPRITLEELRSHPDFDTVDEISRRLDWGGGHIPAHVIESVIEDVKAHAIEEETDGSRQRVARLEERLQIAMKREAQRKHAMQVHRVLELEDLANDCWKDAFEIEKKIIRARCQDRADLMAKWQLYKSNPRHFDERGTGTRLTLSASIARDAVALMQQNDDLPASAAA
jgi:hypothetical protein